MLMRNDHVQELSELYIRLFPYVSASRLRRARTLPDDPFQTRLDTSPGAPINRIGRQRKTSDPSYRVGVGVSTDTLYVSAWLDVSDGPVLLETPEFDGRYYSFQLAFADTSSQESFGQRTHGDQMPLIFICSADWEGDPPSDVTVVRSPTRYVNLPGRIFVDPKDPSDFERVHKLQDGVHLRTWRDVVRGINAPTAVPEQVRQQLTKDPLQNYLFAISSIIMENGLNKDDQLWLNERDFGIDWHDLDSINSFARNTYCLESDFSLAQREIDNRALNLGIQSGGWSLNLNGPRFGSDNLLRAAVARDQIYVTVPEEGVYPLAKTDQSGAPLNGNNNYKITFKPDDFPDTSAFWSITLYDKNGFLYSNPAGIHSVGPHRGVTHDTDGSLTITVSNIKPEHSFDTWLPSPSGEFYLMMRIFLPGEQVLLGKWLPPKIAKI